MEECAMLHDMKISELIIQHGLNENQSRELSHEDGGSSYRKNGKRRLRDDGYRTRRRSLYRTYTLSPTPTLQTSHIDSKLKGTTG